MNQQSRTMQSSKDVQEILKPILYTDIFDYPLTFDEVYQFLEVEATSDEVQTWLKKAIDTGKLVCVDGYYSLTGRDHLAAKRQERQKVSQLLWPKAIVYTHWIATLPFIKMVAITGSLAVNNPRDNLDDVDYLIVTRAGRLWFCRAMIILLVKYVHRRGVHLCPNYIITENALAFEHDFFVARQMVQMKPVYGKSCYLQLRENNAWTTIYFPQGSDLNLEKMNDELSILQRTFKKAAELMLTGFWANPLERWLQTKQITKHTKLAKQRGSQDKVIFTADVCKGHYNGHNHKTMISYRQQLQTYVPHWGASSINGKERK